MKSYGMIFALLLTVMMMVTPSAVLAGKPSNHGSNHHNNDAPTTVNANGQGFADASINDSFNSEGMRGYAIPAEVNFGPVLPYYGKQNPSAGMQSVENFLMYTYIFSEGALENILSGDFEIGPRGEFKVVDQDIELAKADQDGVRWIKIVIHTDLKGNIAKYPDADQLVGYVTAEATSKKTTMIEVMARAALDALQNGCNVLQLTAQGAVTDVFASGWGIGIHTSQARISDGQGDSNVSSGGTGYSSAQAGSRYLPWLQGIGLIDYEMQTPRARMYKNK